MLGSLVSGLPGIIQHQLGLSEIASIRPLFLLYSILGIAVLSTYFLLSKKVELTEKDDEETKELESDEKKKPRSKPLTQTLSPTSKKLLVNYPVFLLLTLLVVALLYKALYHFGFLQNLEQI